MEDLKEFKIIVTEYSVFTVEAETEEEAKEIAKNDVIWSDHTAEISIDAEEF